MKMYFPKQKTVNLLIEFLIDLTQQLIKPTKSVCPPVLIILILSAYCLYVLFNSVVKTPINDFYVFCDLVGKGLWHK